ncbi:MAG: crossover junction endodeoxyribonuclease RuvC [Saprospiraceae bacterium]|nr:crossover junction endodeoxyribonuclease RuvC [Saprospiraceae bacterium]
MTPTTKYRILGVDPGTNILGYGIIEVENKTIQLVDLGVLYLKEELEQPEKLKRIFERLQIIISEFKPSQMAIEAPFYGKNIQSMFKLGRAQGVAIAAAITKGLTVTEYSPKKIKQAVTGNGNAAKEQVAAMLGTILKADLSEQFFDATDALATAVCHYYQSTSRLGAGKKSKDWNAFAKDNPDRVSKK